MHFLTIAYAFACAHQTAFLIAAVVLLSALNKFLPGHPSLKGFFRTVLDVLLAFSPMPGAKSWLFSTLAQKVGPNAAGAFLDWLSGWLNVPLSPSVAPDKKPPLEIVGRGFVRLGFLAVLTIASLIAFAARADANPNALPDAIAKDPAAVQPDEPPAPAPSSFGGCVGKFCFAPSVTISLAAINLSTKKIEGAFSPGLGYGFTYQPGKWYSLGADAYFVVDPGAQQASISVLAAFFNGYFRPGVSKGFIGDRSWRLLLGVGLGL